MVEWKPTAIKGRHRQAQQWAVAIRLIRLSSNKTTLLSDNEMLENLSSFKLATYGRPQATSAYNRRKWF
jgi:hypothetical protein